VNTPTLARVYTKTKRFKRRGKKRLIVCILLSNSRLFTCIKKLITVMEETISMRKRTK
jgi:hypothetical protein